MYFADFVEKEICDEKILYGEYKKLYNEGLDGTLTVSGRNGKRQFYIRRPGSNRKVYAKRDAADEILGIKIRKIGMAGMKRTLKNIDLLKNFADGYVNNEFKNILKNLPKAYELNDEEMREIDRMLNNSYSKMKGPFMESENTLYPEGLKFKTNTGIGVRSKGEMLIANILYDMGVNFRYEKELRLRIETPPFYRTIYPDFTIYSGNDIIYWEHLGMMDDEKYAANALSKITMYAKAGIYPPNNLIITMDFSDSRMNSLDIKKIALSLRK